MRPLICSKKPKNKMNEMIVGMADIIVAASPKILVCKGVGSCIAVTMYDKATKSGGLAHAMLPKQQNYSLESNTGKYVDSAIEHLLSRMQKNGVKKENIEVKIIGGADMFPTLSMDSGAKVGDKNISVAESTLKRLGLNLAKKECGGTSGRTVAFDLATGIVEVKIKI